MANPLPPSMQVCQTCALWGGTRTTNAARNLAIANVSEKGECLGGGFNFSKMPTTGKCGRWMKWPVLK